MGLGCRATGKRLGELFKFVEEEDDPLNLGMREVIDSIGYTQATVEAGRAIVQLGCNRCQLMVAVMDRMTGSSTKVTEKYRQLDPVVNRCPLQERVHWERDDKQGGYMLRFTYNDLVRVYGCQQEVEDDPERLV